MEPQPPDFFMKKLLNLLVMAFFVCAFSLTANAQYINGSTDEIHYKSLGKIVNSNGVKLTTEDLSKIFEPNLYTDYKDASRKYKTGLLLTCVGGALLTYSLTTTTIGFISMQTEDAEMAGALVGVVFFIPATIVTAIGVPKLIKGKKALIGVTEEYNQSLNKKTSATLSVGATSHGIGLALNF